MANRIGLILATVLLSIATSAGSALPFRAGADTFDSACYWTDVMGYEVDCSNLPRPTVVESRIVTEVGGPGTLGLYGHGEPYVYVVSGLSDARKQSVIFHETIHYLLYETYGYEVGRCESEEAARLATDLYNGRDYDPRWKNWYDC